MIFENGGERMPREVYKSADTGEFVSEEFAKENPKTTYKTALDEEDIDTEEFEIVEGEE